VGLEGDGARPRPLAHGGVPKRFVGGDGGSCLPVCGTSDAEMALYFQCLWALVFAGCSFVSPSEFSARMDQDADGAQLGVDCDDHEPELGPPLPNT
jgi:hypothetical protein